jgi:2-polyprenyl-3-methyl-5-hydroxy-6-metoxy-1,4-benzoquinol methylase
VLCRLAAEGRYDLIGSEALLAGLRHAKRRLPDLEFVQLDARDLPYFGEFDAIGAFDVVEHIEEDDAVLASFHRALKPGGRLFITVPQHMWLWSAVDEQAMHKRRYTREEMRCKLVAAGFQILHFTSFVTALLPVLWATRFAKRGASDSEASSSELAISPFLNALFAIVMRIDEALIRVGISLPVGGSLLAVAARS